MLLTVNIIDQNNTSILADITLGVDSVVGASTLASVISDNTNVDILVTKSGYITYAKSVFVYDSAVTISIKICPIITDVSNPNYQRPYPHFFTITDPCSYDVTIYNGSATVYSSIYYYINNELKYINADAVHRFLAFGTFQIKQRMEYTDVFASITYFDVYLGYVEYTRNLASETVEQALNYDVITNFSLSNITPEFVIDLSNPDMLLDSNQYYSTKKDITITPTFLVVNPHCSGTATLSYKIYNAFGNLLFTHEVSTSDTLENQTYTFQMISVGDYKIVASLVDCCNSYDIIKYVSASDFILIYPVSDGCSLYRLSNFSQSISVEVSAATIQGTSVVDPVTVAPGMSVDIPTSAMGTYKIYTKYFYTDPLDNEVPVERYYFISVYCGIEECMAEYMTKLFCKETCKCKDNTNLILTINKMNALLFSYFSHLNSTYSFGKVFDVLSDSDLSMFIEADAILTKIASYCMGTNCKCGC